MKISANTQHTERDRPPYFTVVIPTRNRSEMARTAIASVLQQTFEDFELIISDNSDQAMSGSPDSSWLDKVLKDNRVRYVHWPTPLEMPYHFEAATRLARGEYLAVMTDRWLMRPSTLSVLHRVINSEHMQTPDIIVWPMQSTFHDGKESTAPFTGEVRPTRLRSLLHNFLQFEGWRNGGFYNNHLPRGINCILRRRVSDQIASIHGRIFGPYSPDYAAAFLLCAHVDEMLFVDLPLYMSHGAKSTGLNSFLYGVYSSSVDPFEGCPLRMDTVFNTVVRDFLAARRSSPDRLGTLEFSIEGYYLSVYSELVEKELAGSPMPLKRLFSDWEKAAAALAPDLREAIYRGKKEIDLRRRSPHHYWKTRLLLQWGLTGVVRFLRGVVAGRQSASFQHRKYSDALTAAAGTDHYLTKLSDDKRHSQTQAELSA